MATATPSTIANEGRDPQGMLATLFGVVLVVLGIVGLSGLLTSNGRLLGLLELSSAVSVVHILTGLLGIFLARYPGAGTLFNKLGGVIYLVVFLVGSVALLAGAGGINWATNGLHLLLAIVVGAVGFEGGKRRVT